MNSKFHALLHCVIQGKWYPSFTCPHSVHSSSSSSSAAATPRASSAFLRDSRLASYSAKARWSASGTESNVVVVVPGGRRERAGIQKRTDKRSPSMISILWKGGREKGRKEGRKEGKKESDGGRIRIWKMWIIGSWSILCWRAYIFFSRSVNSLRATDLMREY